MLRALVDPAEAAARPAGAAVVTAALGHDRSIVSVSDGTTCEFTRVIEWGGGSRHGRRPDPGAHALPGGADQARADARLGDRAPEGLSEEQASRARKAMLHEVNAFARELVSSLQFYQAQPGSLDIGEILVTGGDGADARPRRGAAAPDRRRRPAAATRSRASRPASGIGRTTARLARARNRTGDRGLMRAVNLLPEDAQQSRLTAPPILPTRRRRRRRRGRIRRRRRRARRVGHGPSARGSRAGWRLRLAQAP